MMEKRYLKNEQMLSRSENELLRSKSVAVAGCGGLGCHIIEQLARLGVGHITAIDGDVFDESNLNRQLFSTPFNLGKPKAIAAMQRVKQVNPDITIKAVQEMITPENATALLSGHDVVCDALDNIETRFLIQKTAADIGSPLVFGAIAGWYGKVATIFPGDNLLDLLYKNRTEKGIESELGNPSFTPALVAALQVSEVVKILTNKDGLLRNRFLMIDTLNHEYEVFDLKG